MSRPSVPPPGHSPRPAAGQAPVEPHQGAEKFAAGFVRPVPVRGVKQPDGTLTEARSVGEATAAVRAAADAQAPLRGAPFARRIVALFIDLLIAAGTIAGLLQAGQPLAPAIATGLVAYLVIRFVVPVATDGATPGRILCNTRAVREDGEPLDLWTNVQREAWLAFFLATADKWFWLGLEMRAWTTWTKQDLANIQTAGAPHDQNAGTIVDTRAEIARVRAHQAARLARARREAAELAARPPVAQPSPTAQAAAHPQAHTGSAPLLQPLADGYVPPAHVPPPFAPPPAVAQPAPLSAAPYIPAMTQAEPAPELRPSPATHHQAELARRGIAAAIDLAVLAAVAAVLSTRLQLGAPISPMGVGVGPTIDPSYIAAVVIGWLVARPLPLALFGFTLGHRLMGYRVVGRHCERPGLGRSFAREGLGWVGLLIGLRFYGRGATLVQGTDLVASMGDSRQWAHDRMADTWAIRI